MMNNPTPFFSIIIPTYNHAHLIGRCINSLLRQTYQNWEAIIVNNFSEDNTIEIVDSYKDTRIRLINNLNNGVIAVSRNKGISEAKGDWICFLDSDDWWYPNKLELSLSYLINYDIIYHNLDKYVNVNKSKGKIYGRELKDNITKDLLINGNGIPNSSVVISKKIINLVGLISEDKNLIAVEDYDYWIRVTMVTDRFKYVDQSLGAYWIGENISNSLKQIDRYRSILDKYSKYLTSEEQKKSLLIYNYLSARLYHSHFLFNQAKSLYIESFDMNHLKFFLKSVLGYLLCVVRIKK